jgi:hypothetical protein
MSRTVVSACKVESRQEARAPSVPTAASLLTERLVVDGPGALRAVLPLCDGAVCDEATSWYRLWATLHVDQACRGAELPHFRQVAAGLRAGESHAPATLNFMLLLVDRNTSNQLQQQRTQYTHRHSDR